MKQPGENVACMAEKFLSGNLDETDELEDQNIVGRTIIKHIFERQG
jgi:hypothetical protein